MKIDIYDCIISGGQHQHPLKKQYSRDTLIFVCPVCGKRIFSSSFINIAAFERACESHLLDEHNGKWISRGIVEVA